MIYYVESDKFNLVDFDRGTNTAFNFSDQLAFDPQGNPFSPQGEFAFLNNFIFSFKDTSLRPITIDQPHYTAKWSSDTTLIILEISSTPPIQTVLVEYSSNNTKKDTIYRFNPDMDDLHLNWDYDIKRNKLYYSTMESFPTGPVTKLWVYDRTTKRDSILYEYPKDLDTNCSKYSAGTEITEIKWLGNFDKMAFTLVYMLDVSATDIYTYFPDSNKITKVTNGCMHYGKKLHIYWANNDTLVYNDMTQFELFGINVPHITFVKNEHLNLEPNDYSLSQNYPNPFNPSTTIKYQLPKSGKVTLKVFDILGREVASLVNEFKPAGTYEVSFNASALPTGIYFYKLTAAPFTQTRKMLLIK